MGSPANKKANMDPVAGRGYLMSEEEENKNHDVVAGTLLVDSNLARNII